MAPKLRMEIDGDLKSAVDSPISAIKEGATAGMAATANLAKTRLRADIRQAGFKDARKLANTWRADPYPAKGRSSLRPAAWIYSNADAIIASHEEGATIRPVNGARFLWIPTENVPRQGRGGKLMTPLDVDFRFDGMEIIPGTRPGVFLAVVTGIQRTNKRGRTRTREATARRLKMGDVAEAVHMFTLVPMVRLPKRLKGRAIRDDIAMRVMPRLISQGIVQALRAEQGR